MFPNRGESELKQALELNGTLEEAINMVVEDDDRSVNNRYGSLITEECDADVNTPMMMMKIWNHFWKRLRKLTTQLMQH